MYNGYIDQVPLKWVKDKVPLKWKIFIKIFGQVQEYVVAFYPFQWYLVFYPFLWNLVCLSISQALPLKESIFFASFLVSRLIIQTSSLCKNYLQVAC